MRILIFLSLIIITEASIGQVDWRYKKLEVIYENDLATAAQVDDWIMEGPGQIRFEDNWMHMHDPSESGHHVFWCPEHFPTNFLAEWELQNQEIDAGLCIIFFAAHGINGESIFHPSILPRDGVFRKYTKSDINNYHISYYAHTPNAPNRPYAHLRKNAGFYKVQEGNAPIPADSKKIHRVQLIKFGPHIRMFVDGRQLIDWTDDGKSHGPILGEGNIGFRQMQWTHFRYRNFKVWSIVPENPSWPLHVIDQSSEGADGTKLGDINSDGFLDIVTGWEESGVTKMYLHPGPEKVRDKWPQTLVGATPHVEDALFFDADLDGHPEVVSCTESGSEKLYIHKSPNLQWQEWEQALFSDVNMAWMYAEPMQVDDDNGIDLIAAGKGKGAQVGWFEAPPVPMKNSFWKWHALSPAGWIMSIITKDIDQDGDLDIVLTDRRGPLQGCRWLENPASLDDKKVPWQNHLIGGAGREVMFMTMADLDGDGIEEVIVPERTQQEILLFKKKSGNHWDQQSFKLPDNIGLAKSVEVGDLNGDGISDFVISTNTGNEQLFGLSWLDGQRIKHPNQEDFKPISGRHRAKYDKVVLSDIDGDGDLDILICEENFGANSKGLGVVWYENK